MILIFNENSSMTLRGYIVILKRDGSSGSFCDWRADKCVFGR